MRTGKTPTPIKPLLGSSSPNAFSINVSIFVPAPWTQDLMGNYNAVIQDHLWITSFTVFSHVQPGFSLLVSWKFSTSLASILSLLTSFFLQLCHFLLCLLPHFFFFLYLLPAIVSFFPLVSSAYVLWEISSSLIVFNCLNANDPQTYVHTLSSLLHWCSDLYSLFYLSEFHRHLRWTVFKTESVVLLLLGSSSWTLNDSYWQPPTEPMDRDRKSVIALDSSFFTFPIQSTP